VNRSQSTNDVFPAAIHVAATQHLTHSLLPAVQALIDAFDHKAEAWFPIVKIGRTHLQDAVPLRLGDEVSAWRDQLKLCRSWIEDSLTPLAALPLGGTAVGTGLNAPKGFSTDVAKELCSATGLSFHPADNLFAVMAGHDALVHAMGQLRGLAVALLRIANDIRLLGCGPRAGLGELRLPANEPGSSIMPGKINPTQCEAMAMVCTQVIGLDAAVAAAGAGGHLQMNVFKPLIGFNLLQSIRLLSDAINSFRQNLVVGLEPNHQQIQAFVERSLMLVTALTPRIGYEKASAIAQHAHEQGLTLKDAALKLGHISASDFDQIVDPIKMAIPHE
jgi:fumarate hydratase class II